MYAVGQSRLARRRGAENLLPPMRCGTGKGQVAGCGVAPTDEMKPLANNRVWWKSFVNDLCS
jgi:hypothetical protein